MENLETSFQNYLTAKAIEPYKQMFHRLKRKLVNFS